MQEDGLIVLGLTKGGNSGEADAVDVFVEQMGLTFPVAWDSPGSYDTWSAAGAIGPFPLDVVVDRTGKVTYLSRSYEPEELKAAVEDAL